MESGAQEWYWPPASEIFILLSVTGRSPIRRKGQVGGASGVTCAQQLVGTGLAFRLCPDQGAGRLLPPPCPGAADALDQCAVHSHFAGQRAQHLQRLSAASLGPVWH